MRAILSPSLGPLENYAIHEVECAAPAAGEIQVDVWCAGVTYVDALIAMGRHQTPVPKPFIPGNEVAGVVTALGEGVSGFAVGDRVACVGVGGKYAERVTVPAHAALGIPEAMSFEQASVFRGGFSCANYALVQAGRLQPNESVVVLGAAGAVGQAAVQLASAMGARVLASASTEEKRQLALKAGAHCAIDANAPDWRDQVKAWAGSRGVDVVVDPVGGAATERAFRSLGIGGRLLSIGFASGTIPSIPLNLVLVKNASLIGVELSKFEKGFPQAAAANDRALIQLYLRGAITAPTIAHRFDFTEFRQALELAATGRSAGSIVMRLRAG